MPLVKSLETYLWGYRFRSRIEARWAVLFDRAGIEWQYETEGFLLPSGPYLPDFFLPGYGLWFEVKGRSADDEERQRCRELSYSEFPVLLAEGPVGERPLTLFAFDCTPIGGGESEWNAYLGFWNDKHWLFVRNLPEEVALCNHKWDPLKCNTHGCNNDAWQSVADAVRTARSARFEHGQSPERRSAC